MRKKGSVILGIILASVLLACSNTKEIVEEDMEIANFQLGDTTNIGINDIVLCSNDLGLFVQFDSLLTDSRCPVGANCIWAGNASIALSVTYLKELESITLNTDAKLGNTKKAFGFSFELISVNPYPGSPNFETRPKSIDIIVNKVK